MGGSEARGTFGAGAAGGASGGAPAVAAPQAPSESGVFGAAAGSSAWQIGAFAVLFVLIACAAGALSGIAAALWVLAAGACGCVLFAFVSAARHREIVRLSSEIDAVLHDGRSIAFSSYREGDVAVLRNEVAKMVARLARTTEQLEREKSALADALADVSHQIRTPLTAMSLMIPTIERAEGSARTSALRELEAMIDRLSWLVTALLKTAQMDAGALKVEHAPVSAARMLRRAIAPLEAALDVRGIACEVRAGSEAFIGDERWCAEAVENIVKNCMEHTPAGGLITATATEDALATRIAITDTGPGISADDLPHVFERFYRGADARPEGFGIGLSLAQALVTAQGGTLRASNAPAGGARFDIAFPKTVV